MKPRPKEPTEVEKPPAVPSGKLFKMVHDMINRNNRSWQELMKDEPK